MYKESRPHKMMFAAWKRSVRKESLESVSGFQGILFY